MRTPCLSLFVLLMAWSASAQEVPHFSLALNTSTLEDTIPLITTSSGPARVSLSAPLGPVPSIHRSVQELGRDQTQPIQNEGIGAWTITGFAVDGSSKLQCAAETRADNGASFAYLVEASRDDPDIHTVILVSSPAPEGSETSMLIKMDSLLIMKLQGVVKDNALELRPALNERSAVHNAIRNGNWLLLVRPGQPEALRVNLHGSADALRSLAECTSIGLGILKE